MDTKDFKNLTEAILLFFGVIYALEWLDLLYVNFGFFEGIAPYLPEWLNPIIGRAGFSITLFAFFLYGKPREPKDLKKGDRFVYSLLILVAIFLSLSTSYLTESPDKLLYLNITLVVLIILSFPKIIDCFPFLIFRDGSKIEKIELDSRYPLAKQPLADTDEMGFSFKTNMGYLNIARPQQGVAIIGGAGAGKTYSFLNPMLRDIPKKSFTGWVYNFKFPVQATVLYRAWLHADPKVRPELYIVNFTDILRSNRANPLRIDNLENKTYVQEFSATFLKNLNPEWIRKQDFWYSESHNMVVAAIEFLKNNEPQYCTLPHLTTLLLQDLEEVVKLLCNDFSCKEDIQSIKTAFDKRAEGQISGVVASVQSPFKKINTEEIFWVLSGDDFDFNLNNERHIDTENPENNRSPKILCVGNDPSLSASLSPIISLFASVCMKKLNRQDRLKSVFFNDEMPTLFIPNLDELPATARSNKVCTILGFQDASQMVKNWGREVSDALLANLGTQLCGMVNHTVTAEVYSKLFGKDDIKKKSTSYGENESFSVSTQRQSIVEPTVIMNQKQGHFLGKLSTGELVSAQVLAEDCPTNEELPVISTILTEENKERIIKENFKKIKEDIQELLLNYRQVAKDELSSLVKRAKNGDADEFQKACDTGKIVVRQKKDGDGFVDLNASTFKLEQGYVFSFAEVDVGGNSLF